MPTKKSTPKAKPVTDTSIPKESKEQKVVRLGTKRVNAAITKLRLIGQLATYKPTSEQVDKIEQQIGSSCAAMMNKLRMNRKAEETFTL